MASLYPSSRSSWLVAAATWPREIFLEHGRLGPAHLDRVRAARVK